MRSDQMSATIFIWAAMFQGFGEFDLQSDWVGFDFLAVHQIIWALRLVGFKASLLHSEDHPFDSDSAYKKSSDGNSKT